MTFDDAFGAGDGAVHRFALLAVHEVLGIAILNPVHCDKEVSSRRGGGGCPNSWTRFRPLF